MLLKKGKHEIHGKVREGKVPRKKRKIVRTLVIILGIIIMIGIAVMLFASSKLDKLSFASPKIDQDSAEKSAEEISEDNLTAEEDGLNIIGSTNPPEGDVFKDKNVANILIIGTDGALGGPGDTGRADCVMLCSLNKKTGDVKLISFERGIPVQFDVYPHYDILTHAYHWGGSELVQEMIEKYFLLDLLGYVHVSYDAFMTGIDAIGGVDIELTQLEAAGLNEEVTTNAATKAEVHEGVNHLDGYDALQYCRLRFIDSDWHRIERQRNTVQAAMNQAKTLSFKQLNSVADQMLPLIETNLSKTDIMSLLFYVPKFIKANAGQMTVPEHTPGDPDITCDFSKETEKIKTFLYD